MNLLVLGVGGNVSQGILKALARGSLPHRVVGACVRASSLGLYTVDEARLCPYADDPAFEGWLFETCRREKVQGVLSGVEAVLERLAACAERLRQETGAVAIVSPPDRLAIGSDKLRTCQWLEANGLHFPRYAAVEDEAAVDRLVAAAGLPLVAKPRHGRRSMGLIEVRDEADLRYARTRPGYVLQENLGTPDTEYTVGCVGDREGRVRGVIVLHREILGGSTHQAEAGLFPAVREEARRVATALRPLGPCNIQMRESAGRPVSFEINVRFSGTTPARVQLGFDEVGAVVRHFVLGEEMPELPVVTSGLMLRYLNEMYVDPAACRALEQAGVAGDLGGAARLEDFGLRR
ncbi:MAG TPA: ATP-grasp domain-containing protein [Vicinamibacteria bacterium]